MSYRNPDLNIDNRGVTETNHPTDSTSTRDNSITTSTQEKDHTAMTVSDDKGPEYVTGLRLFLIMFTIFMSTLLAALEIGIIATAIPGITNDFRRLDDVGWYASATFLVGGATSPMWGKLYKYLDVKYVYIVSVGLYLIGSIVGAAAPNSAAVIVGRAIQGWGATGTLSGSVLVINYVARPKRRPLLIGSWMAVFMVSTILGPIIGGVLTSEVSWRWCFWINLPLGAPIFVLLVLFLRIPKHIKPAQATWKEIILQLDLPGFSVLLASLVCLTLGLQWGGQTKPWDQGSVIAVMVVFVVLSTVFFVIEWFQKTRAMVPLHLLKPRVVWSNFLYCFLCNAAFFQVMFYLPIYFQSIHEQSAIISGVNTIPFLAFFALGSMVSGGAIGKTRHLQPYQLTCVVLMTAGMALFYTLDVGSSKARYFGPEILFGFGLGVGHQIPVMAVQGFSKPEDVASSTGIMLMCQSISGGYFTAVAQSIFANRMLEALRTTAPDINSIEVLNTGASDIQKVFQGADLDAVINAYMVGIQDVFACALACSACAVLIALLIPLKRLPDPENKKLEERMEKS